MFKIFKYAVNLHDTTKLTIPSGAEIVMVEQSWSDPTAMEVWFKIIPNTEIVNRTFEIRVTGEPFAGIHRGSCRIDGGFVWHLIEVANV